MNRGMAMVKQSVLSFIVSMIVIFSFQSFVYGASYTDHTKDIEVIDEYIEQILSVYTKDDDYDQAEVQKMIDRLSRLPSSIKKELVNEGIELYLIDFPIPQLEGYEYLENEHPRGHPEGTTWNDITGMSTGNVAVAKIGYSYPNQYSSTILLEYHELFHAIDEGILGNLSVTELGEFIAVHEEEHDWLDPGEDYYEYIEEFFAEAAAYYYRGGEYRNILKARTPKTYNFFRAFADRLVVIEQLRNGKIEMTWNGNTNATSYDIYRNDELLETISGTVYVDNSFEPFESAEYLIEGKDEAGDIVYRTLRKQVNTPDNEVVTITDADIKIKEQTDQSVTLKWNAPNFSDYYKVYRDGKLLDKIEGVTFEDHLTKEEINEKNGSFIYEVEAHIESGSSDSYNPKIVHFEVEEEPENEETPDNQDNVTGETNNSEDNEPRDESDPSTGNQAEDETAPLSLPYIIAAISIVVIIAIIIMIIKRKKTES